MSTGLPSCPTREGSDLDGHPPGLRGRHSGVLGCQATPERAVRDQGRGGSGHGRLRRGGKHFDAIATLLAKFFLDAGYPPESIRVNKSQGLELPGYYRPQKQWDVVVVHENVLIAAFEMKALGGPS